jgi:hypothetical protein
VNLSTNVVERNVKLGPFTHPNSDGEEIVAVEKALLAHPEVQAEIAKLKLPEGTVLVADPWIYGASHQSLFQVLWMSAKISQAPMASKTANSSTTSG